MHLNFKKISTGNEINFNRCKTSALFNSFSLLGGNNCAIKTDGFVYEFQYNLYDPKHHAIREILYKKIEEKQPVCICGMQTDREVCVYCIVSNFENDLKSDENASRFQDYLLYRKSYTIQSNSETVIENNLPRHIHPIFIEYDIQSDRYGTLHLKDKFLHRLLCKTYSNKASLGIHGLLFEEKEFIVKNYIKYKLETDLRDYGGMGAFLGAELRDENYKLQQELYENKQATSRFFEGDLRFNRINSRNIDSDKCICVFPQTADRECSYLMCGDRDLIIKNNNTSGRGTQLMDATEITVYYREIDPQIYEKIQKSLIHQFEENGYMIFNYGTELFYIYQAEGANIIDTLRKIFGDKYDKIEQSGANRLFDDDI